LNQVKVITCIAPIEDIPEEYHIKACRGFFEHEDQYSDNLKQSYYEVIYSADFLADAPDLVELLIHRRLLPAWEVDTCIKFSTEAKHIELTAALLHYKFNVLTAEERERGEHIASQRETVRICAQAREGKQDLIGLTFAADDSLGTFTPPDFLRNALSVRGAYLADEVDGFVDYLIISDPHSQSPAISEACLLGIETITEDALLEKLRRIQDIVICDDAPTLPDVSPLTFADIRGLEFSCSTVHPWRFIGQRTLRNVSFDENVREIGEGAFFHCNSLSKAEFAEGLTHIGKLAFFGCRRLSDIKLPDTLRHIGEGAFKKCPDLKKIVIPEGVTAIERDAFSYCTHLTEVVLPSTVEKIASGAFRGCRRLTVINVPKGASVAPTAFEGCAALKAAP